MKKLTIIFITGFIAFSLNAQIMSPVEWIYKVDKISSNEYKLHALAIIEKPWHLYGQYFEDGGPVTLKFSYIENENYNLIDSVTEKPNPIIEKDEIFGIDVNYFSGKAIFTQKVKIKRATEIIMMIEGQVCNDKTGMCVMVTDEHVFMLK